MACLVARFFYMKLKLECSNFYGKRSSRCLISKLSLRDDTRNEIHRSSRLRLPFPQPSTRSWFNGLNEYAVFQLRML